MRPAVEEVLPCDDRIRFETRDLYDGLVLANVASGTAQDASRVVAATPTAFDLGRWPRVRAVERAAMVHAMAGAVDAHRAELAELETRFAAKPFGETLNAGVLLRLNRSTQHWLITES